MDNDAGLSQSNVLDENVLVELLSSTASRQQALHYIDQNITRNSNLLALLDRPLLFENFQRVLADVRSPSLQIQCTMLVAKIIPLLRQHELDRCMHKIMSKVVANIGSTIKLQRESIQLIHIYMKHTSDFRYILHSLAYDGLRHKDAKTRHQVLLSFPALLFNQFRHHDFFDIVHTLVLNLDEPYLDNALIRKVWKVLRDYVGVEEFSNCVERLPNPLKTMIQKHDMLASSSTDDHSSSSFLLDDSLNASPTTTTNNNQSASPVKQQQDVQQQQKNSNQLGFISKQMLEKLSSPKAPVRLEAVLQLKQTIELMQDVDELRTNVSPLMSILQPVVADKNTDVSINSLHCLHSCLNKIGYKLTANLDMFVSLALIQMGCRKVEVKGECVKLLLGMMEVATHQKVIDVVCRKIHHHNNSSQVGREDLVDFITIAILNFQTSKFDTAKLAHRLSKLLIDKNWRVRLATLECYAALAEHRGEGLRVITSAINQLEMQYDAASGAMSALNARLVRKQPPTFTLPHFIINYSHLARFHPPQSADVQWIQAVAPSGDKQRHLKQSTTAFPWTVSAGAGMSSNNLNDEADGRVGQPNKHPNSAPIQHQHQMSRKQVMKPSMTSRITWGEIPSTTLASTVNTSQPHQKEVVKTFLPTTDNNQQQDSYRRDNLKDVRYSLKQAGNKRTSYKPSFATAGTANNHTMINNHTNNNTTTTTTMTNSEKSMFSNSCPSSFFEMTSSRIAAQLHHKHNNMVASGNKHKQPSMSHGKPTISNVGKPPNTAAAGGAKNEMEVSRILTKPALVRSASKNRATSLMRNNSPDNAVTVATTLATTRHRNIDTLMNSSMTSPRLGLFDVTTSDDDGNLMKKHPSKDEDGGGVTSPPAYTPSAVLQHQQTTISTTTRNNKLTPRTNNNTTDLHHSPQESKYLPSHRHQHRNVQHSPPLGGAVSSTTTTTTPPRGTDVASFFDKEILPDTSQMASIRRSAQDKRQRMLRSQPASRDQLFSSEADHRTANSAQSSFRTSGTGGLIDLKKEFINDGDVSLSSNFNRLSFNNNKPPLPNNGDEVAIVGKRIVDQHQQNHNNLDRNSNTQDNKLINLSPTISSTNFSFKNDSNINIQGRGFSFGGNSSTCTTSTTTTGGGGGNKTNKMAASGVLNSSSSGGKNNEVLYQTWSSPVTNNKRGDVRNRKTSFQSSTSNHHHGKPAESSSSGYFTSTSNNSSNDELLGSKPPSQANSESSMKRLENPERWLQQSLHQIEGASNEEWEQITSGLNMIQRLAQFHPNLLSTKFSQVVRLVTKQVSNLRSQVSRNAVVTISSIYSNLAKPAVDVDLEFCIRALLGEYGKTNTFMREEISKALQHVLDATSNNRFLSTLINTGHKHKNKDVRNITSNFTSKLVFKLGCERVYNKDFAERIFDVTASFICDSSPDVRFNGRSIVSVLMKHEKFGDTCDQLLTKAQCNELNKCVNNILERGLTSSQSSGGYKRTSYHQQQQQKQTASLQEPEELKEILTRINKGDIQSKREAISDLFEKTLKRSNVSDHSVKKIMECLISLLSTSNSKANLLALSHMPRLIEKFHLRLTPTLHTLLPALLKLTVSRHANMAKEVVNLVIQNIDNNLLVQGLANQALYAHGKTRQFVFEKLTEMVGEISQRSVERHLYPVLWALVKSAPNQQHAVYLKRHIENFTQALYNLNPQRLLDEANHNKLLPNMKSLLHIT